MRMDIQPVLVAKEIVRGLESKEIHEKLNKYYEEQLRGGHEYDTFSVETQKEIILQTLDIIGGRYHSSHEDWGYASQNDYLFSTQPVDEFLIDWFCWLLYHVDQKIQSRMLPLSSLQDSSPTITVTNDRLNISFDLDR